MSDYLTDIHLECRRTEKGAAGKGLCGSRVCALEAQASSNNSGCGSCKTAEKVEELKAQLKEKEVDPALGIRFEKTEKEEKLLAELDDQDREKAFDNLGGHSVDRL